MATTQTVTVLFTDLVASTELSSRLDPRAADQLRGTHFALLRSAVKSCGGAEVKNLGDGLMVVFSGPSQAMACAQAMQQNIERHNREAPERLAVRIGMSLGEVSEEEGDYFGDAVVEAARLCAAAAGGQILATQLVQLTAGRRAPQGCVVLGELELKGLPAPVAVVELQWAAPLDEIRVPLPARLASAPTVGFVGRRSERDRLEALWKAVGAGEGHRIALVSGEAGVGKTTLVAEAARAAFDGGAIVVYGRCDEDVSAPYQPFVQAIGHYAVHAPDELLAGHGPERLAHIARLVPELARRVPDLVAPAATDPDAERWLMFGAVAATLAELSMETPVVVVLDDLHWADRPTLQLLRYLAAAELGRVLILGTYRDRELSTGHPLTEALAALRRERGVERLALCGLDDTEVIAFVEFAAGHDLDETGVALAHALHRDTGGNPFFVAEVLRHLDETGALTQDAGGRWSVTVALSELGVPDSVREVVGARVARLGSEAQRVLSSAAVMGSEFDLDVLARVADVDEDRLLELLERASAVALVVESGSGRFRFAHDLIHHTLYADLGTTRQARLHHRVGEALEAICGGRPGERSAELARHWLAAVRPADVPKAVGYARQAGEQALTTLAPDDAIRWFSEALQALELAPDEPTRATILAGLGDAQRQAGDPTYRETLLEAARLAQAAGDASTLIRAALATHRGLQSSAGRVDAERVAVLEAAIEAAGDPHSPLRARLLASLALERTYDGDYPARRAVADEALAIARRSGDPATILDVLLRRWQSIWMADTVDELLVEATEIEALAETVGDPVARFWASGYRAFASIMVGDVTEVGRCLEDASRQADALRQPILRWAYTYTNAWRVLLAGDVEGSEALANEVLELGNETGQPDTLAIYGAQLIHIRVHQGRGAELAGVLAQIAGDNPGVSPYQSAVALLYADIGRHDEAWALLDAEAASGFAAPDDFLLPVYLVNWAEVATRVGHPAAAVLYQRLSPWPQLVVFTGCTVHGAVAHMLGELATTLARFEAADAHFRQALSIHENMAAPFFIARTKLEWGRMLVARDGPGDAEQARQLLRAADGLARSHGYAAVEQRATDLLVP